MQEIEVNGLDAKRIRCERGRGGAHNRRMYAALIDPVLEVSPIQRYGWKAGPRRVLGRENRELAIKPKFSRAVRARELRFKHPVEAGIEAKR